MTQRHSFRRQIARVLVTLLVLIALPQLVHGAEPKSPTTFDVLIKGGTVYDGTGEKPRVTDIAIRGERVVGLGSFPAEKASTVIDAKGMAVAPGFINMLSWSTESLIEDGRSQSEIREGVTTEIMGEGFSMGPLNDRIKERMRSQQGDIKYEIKWNTLAEYLRYLEQRGVSCNVASFILATSASDLPVSAIREGMFADIIVFDPATIADRATFEKPHQYAVGMKQVFVNGVQVLKNGNTPEQSRGALCGDRAKYPSNKSARSLGCPWPQLSSRAAQTARDLTDAMPVCLRPTQPKHERSVLRGRARVSSCEVPRRLRASG